MEQELLGYLAEAYVNKLICKKWYESKREEFKEFIKTEKRTTIQTSIKGLLIILEHNQLVIL